jgi:predicted nuclease of predicted toxin-antitoxin system
MRSLIDECLPRKLKFLFAEGGHHCETVREAGLGGKENGELLALADRKFDVLITVDKNIRHQQNVQLRRLAILVIRAASNDLDDLRLHRGAALASLQSIKPREVVEVGIVS